MTPRHPAVCIPVRGAPDSLEMTLAAIRATHGALEVVVAIDGPDDDLRRRAANLGAGVVVLPAPAGSYAARNAAIDALPDGVDAVLFTDAGCEPRHGWVEAHLSALADAELSVGGVEWRATPAITPSEWVDMRRHLRQEKYASEGHGATCNLAVRRSVLDAVRFDGARRSGGDRLFCAEAVARGNRLVYSADAIVVHPARARAIQIMRKAYRVGVGAGSLPPVAALAGLPRLRPTRDLLRQAEAAGLAHGLGWRAAVVSIDFARLLVFRAGAAIGRLRAQR